MENVDIIYTTPKQQLEKLRLQNLIIQDEEYAEWALSLYGYSSLIKSYREPYMITSSGQKIYRSGVTFDQICSLYLLDKNLRNAVMAAMLDLEEHIKEAVADVIAKSFGTHPDNYLKYRNYQNKRKRKQRFSLTGILETLNKTLDTDKNPIRHYQAEHGIVPPWILFKSVYFSTINNFIDQFKIPQQNQLVEKLYNLHSLKLPVESARKLMMDTLFICQEYRNVAAHGGRTYNYSCHTQLRVDEIFNPNEDLTISGFSQLLFLLDLLAYSSPVQHLNSVLENEVNRHCSLYPQDVTYLGQILNMNIIQKDMVYISENSEKFHINPHCSGIKNTKRIELDEAVSHGFVACKKCANNLF